MKRNYEYGSEAMNMVEALKASRENPKLWARPIAWRGHGTAFAWHKQMIVCVPNLHGGRPALIPAFDFDSEWEVVEARLVNEGS